jgi:hypothetical protein
MNYRVEISQFGRGGSINYTENEQALRLDWEFATDGAYIFVPTPEQWDGYWRSNDIEWAAGRRQEILERVAEAVRREKAQSSNVTLEDNSIHFKF